MAFDAGTGAERQRLRTSCMRFALSPDASSLAVIGEEQVVLHAVAGGAIAPEPVWKVPVPKVFYQVHFRELSFATDGRSLGVRVGFDDFREIDVATGGVLQSHGYKTSFPDNELVGLGAGGRGIVLTSRSPARGTRLLSFETGASLRLDWPPGLRSVWSHQGGRMMRSSRDGRLLLGTGILEQPRDDVVCVWDAASGKLLGSWQVAPGRVDAAIFSHDEKSVLAATDEAIWQIDIASGKLTSHPRGSRDEVQDFAVSSDGRFLFAADVSGAVQRWDLRLGADTSPKVESYSCAALSSGGALALVGGGKVTVVDAKGERGLSPGGAAGRARFSPDGRALVTGAGSLQLWSTESNKLLGALPDAVFWPSFAVGDGWVAFIHYTDWSLHRRAVSPAGFTDMPSLDLETPCTGGTFSQIARSRDGSKLAVAYGPGFDHDNCANAEPGSFPDNTHARPIPGEPAAPFRLRVYDTKSWSVVASRGVSGDQVPSLAMEAGGDLVALGTKSGVEIWSISSRQKVASVPVDAELVEVAFVPGRPWLAVGSATGKLRIYDHERGSSVVELDAHLGPITCLDASETRLASTGFEGTVALWALEAAPAK